MGRLLLRGRLSHLLARASLGRRMAGAESLLLGGGVRPVDRLLANLYFGVSAPEWARHLDDPAYLEPLRAGADHLRPPARVLDVGTGPGGSADYLAHRFPQADVCAIDVSRAMLAQARRRFSRPNLRFMRADAQALPFPDGHFDLVVCVNAVPEPRELLRVSRRDAELLAVSSFSPPPVDGPWRDRWRELGFLPHAHELLGAGGFDLLRRGAAEPLAGDP